MAPYNDFYLKRYIFGCAVFIGAAFITVVHAVNFHTIEQTLLLYTFGNHITRSAIDCCRSCDNDNQCVLANYNRVTRDCTFANNCHLNSSSTTVTDDDWSVYTRNADLSPVPRNLVFLAVAGLGTSIYQAFSAGTNTVSTPQCYTCNPGACTQHFRNSSLDSWATLNVKKVKYSFCYTNGTEVAYVVFNGTSSSLVNLFTSVGIIMVKFANIQVLLFQFGVF